MNEKTNESANHAEPKTFEIIDGNTLMAQEYEPLKFSVEKILPHGLFILAGSGKIGKSWLSLDLCVNVATGGKLWEFSSEQGDVLYLALEDNYPRLQDRLNKIQAASVDISRLKLTTAAFGISNGLLEQTHNHLSNYPETKLIIIDTLERVRDTEFDKNIYACDYRDMTTLRGITDKHDLTLLLIHHTRKMSDSDPLNTLSGTRHMPSPQFCHYPGCSSLNRCTHTRHFRYLHQLFYKNQYILYSSSCPPILFCSLIRRCN
jgi:RecA-family ATPase